jgi:hypothetical protein
MGLRDQIQHLKEAVEEYRSALEVLDDLGFGIHESEMDVHKLSMAANAINDKHKTSTTASRIANHRAALAAKAMANQARSAGKEHKAAEFDALHHHHMYHPIHGPLAGRRPKTKVKSTPIVNAATAESVELNPVTSANRWSKYAHRLDEKHGSAEAVAEAHKEAAEAHLSAARYVLCMHENSRAHFLHTQKALSHLALSEG